MNERPFGPRGAEDEREGFWTTPAETSNEFDAQSQQQVQQQNQQQVQQELEEPLPPEFAPGLDELDELDGLDSVDGVEDLTDHQASGQDPLGSWTGVPSEDEYGTPTQDADDL